MKHRNHSRSNHLPMRLGARRAQRGLTLIEFMISITIGMFIVIALTLLIARQSATQAEFEKSSRQIENGRYAMRLLSDDIQMAGYYGEFSKVSDIAVPGSLPNPCLVTVAEVEAAMAFPIQGYDSPGASPLTCINAANYLIGTDILVVRRATPDLVTPAVAASAAGQMYLQSGLTSSGLEFTKKMGKGADLPGSSVFDLFNKDRLTQASLREFIVRIYFVSPCSVPASGGICSGAADNGKPIPTLKMLELNSAGVLVTTPLVEGIENMQIDYGFDTTLDGSPDGQFKSTTAVVADWSNLVALRVHLLSRNLDSSPDYIDSRIYTLGYNDAAALQTVSPTTDSYLNNVQPFKRHVYSQLIRLVNPSGRRDQ